MIADRLRLAILQAAISGKLTDQRPEDGTATELLEQIKAERAALVKAKKLQKQKALQPVTEESQPFVIPASWEWVRFQDVNQFRIGKTPKRAEPKFWSPSEVPWVSISDMTQGGSIASTKEGVSAAAIAECFGGQTSPAGTLIMSFKLTIGRCSFLGRDAVHNEAIVSIFPAMSAGESFSTYLSHALPLLTQLGDSKAAIKGNTLNSESIANLPIPLPPPMEQERIVAKLDEVLPLIDQLAELEREREYLDREFAKAIERAILQAAISGKLTKQHPEDGTAEELLETIKTERQKLEKEGEIKQQKPLPPVEKTDEPFELPDTWEWAQIGSIVDLINGRAYKRQELQTSGKWPVLRVGNLFTNETWYYSDLDLEDDKYCSNGDLLYAWSASFGPHIWRGEKSIFHYHIWKIRYYSINRDYLNYVLQWDVERIRTATTGSTMVHVSMTNMRPRTIPVAPVEEQDRIVKRLDSLLPLVNQIGKLVS